MSTANITCPSCKKQGNAVKHCIMHCEQYIMANVTQRAEWIKQAGYCVVCLHHGHKADTCAFRDRPASKCGFNNCSKHHHPTLHGAKDPYVTSVNIVSTVQPPVSMTPYMQPSHKFYQPKRPVCPPSGQHAFNTNPIEDRREDLEELKRLLTLPMQPGGSVLMQMQRIWVQYGPRRERTLLNTFWDNGSTCSLIVSSVAERYKLPGY